MGLFDFMKNVGADLFGGGKDEAKEVEALLNNPSLSSAAKRKLKSIHKEHVAQQVKARKQGNAKIGGLVTVADKNNPISAEKWKGDSKKLKSDKELQEAGSKEVKQRQKTKEEIQRYVDEGGEVEEYERGGKAPEQTMRSKSAEKISGGVKRKLATGEGIAVRDKAYGESLDSQARLKREIQRQQDAKKPDVINVSNAPEIPEEHANDPVISQLMGARAKATKQEHVDVIDDHINQHVSKLQSLNKSSNKEQLVFNTAGQWALI